MTTNICVQELWGTLSKCINGAIDGTHVSITAPKEHPEAYVNRKGVHSMQLQVVCDHTGKFIHCYTGHLGSVHVVHFMRSEVFQFLNDPEKFPNNYHLLGDAAYTLHKHLMVPYKDNSHLTIRQINYNKSHSSTRMAIEKAIGLLKGRLRRLLDNLPMTRTDLIPKYIIACCVIHNICLCLLRHDHFQPLAIAINAEPLPHINEAIHVDILVDRNLRDIARRKRDLIAEELPIQENV
ncbi:putative nuclease HARBI1 [Photinus pyralis]|uniref:putative nuclease HARBI1 n=1 Tax=Photinus pyralis TaxID=7054 RepID=UPI0012677A42|nr:putative nuclease HARBI1 [Photinus pyralis]